MENVIFFSTRDDEKEFIEKENEKFNYQIKMIKEPLTIQNIDLVEGYRAISVSSAYPISEQMLSVLRDKKVEYISTRATGHNHVDINTARSFGIRLGYVPGYSPNAISEFAIGLALAIVRNIKWSILKEYEYDFTYSNLIGKQLNDMTVGIIGDGNIGFEAIKGFAGLGSKVIVYARHEKEHVKEYAQYVTLDELLRKSDLISLHCPLTDETRHLIDENAFEKMKEGVFIVNTARGALINHEALIKFLDNRKVSAVGLDVYEDEGAIIRKKLDKSHIQDDTIMNLLNRPNVIYTPHIAFLTKNAVSTITHITFKNINEYFKLGTSDNDLW